MLFQSKAGATEVGGAEVGGAEVPFGVGLAAVSFPAEPAVAPPVAVTQMTCQSLLPLLRASQQRFA